MGASGRNDSFPAWTHTREADTASQGTHNNGSERAVKMVALGRKAWLFIGSHDHGQSMANLMTLIATARLHGLEPETYLRELLRVLPYWPRKRYIELGAMFWINVRTTLDPDQLAADYGPLHIPDPIDIPWPTTAKQ